MELSDEEDEEEKGEEKNTNNNMEDDSKVNKIKKRNTKYWWIPCRVWKLQKPFFANALLEKGTGSAFKIVEKIWNERS